MIAKIQIFNLLYRKQNSRTFISSAICIFGNQPNIINQLKPKIQSGVNP